MFDVSGAELLAMLALALFIFGPERLPKVAADAARMLRQLRTMIAGAKEDMRRELGPELEGIDLADLNPRTFVKRNLLDDADLGLDDLDGTSRPARARPPARRGAAHRPVANGNGHSPGASNTAASSRAESSRAESSRAESSRAEPPPPFDADAT